MLMTPDLQNFHAEDFSYQSSDLRVRVCFLKIEINYLVSLSLALSLYQLYPFQMCIWAFKYPMLWPRAFLCFARHGRCSPGLALTQFGMSYMKYTEDPQHVVPCSRCHCLNMSI